MMHKPIQIKNLSFALPHKICFTNFTTQINHGSRIAIIGRNGSGKTTLLNLLHGTANPTDGDINYATDVVFGFVPQVIENYNSLSGGQRLNKAMTLALNLDPNILLLDEPTNHLDQSNRKSLMRMLQSYSGTLIVVSHDTQLLRHCIDTLWHIDNGQIHVFSGNYDDYMRETKQYQSALEQELADINKQKKSVHQSLMKEQQRAAKSKSKGKKNIHRKKWPTVVSSTKASRAEETSGLKKSAIDLKKNDLTKRLSNLHLPETIQPKFSIDTDNISDRCILSISDGCLAYQNTTPIMQQINLAINSKSRIAVLGNNASGKSTLIKAILDDNSLIKSGDWILPKCSDIGYLDQHYKTLDPEKTVCEIITERVPTWSHADVRRHLNDFLFRKNEEINSKITQLSGGEKARLTLAQIAASTPKLLILDEITNNLDLDTKKHVIDVLKKYPGALIVISHDPDFLQEINIKEQYQITNGVISLK